MEIAELHTVARQRDIASSGVSWGAVIAGSFVAAALSLILLALGAGLGLSAVSPWSNLDTAASALGAAAIVWLIVVQIASSAMGGYLAGRLRTKWESIHNDEVHFRDTANGLISWAVGIVITVSFLVTAATTMVGRTAGSEGAATSDNQETIAYFVDYLFRSDHPGVADPLLQAQASRIFASSLRGESASDVNYLDQLVVAKTGLSPDDAAKRVTQTIADARQAEDTARKTMAHALLWIFIALLTGAFCASYAATIGGRQRDHVEFI